MIPQQAHLLPRLGGFPRAALHFHRVPGLHGQAWCRGNAVSPETQVPAVWTRVSRVTNSKRVWSLRIAAFSSALGPHWVGSSVSWPGDSGQPCSFKAEVPPRCRPHPRLEPRSAPLRTTGCESQGARGLLGSSDSRTDSEPEKLSVYRYSSVFWDTNRDPPKAEAPGRSGWPQGPLPQSRGTTHPRDVCTGLYID